MNNANLLRSRGFSLVEVMVATLVATLLMGSASLMLARQQQDLHDLAVQLGINDLSIDIRRALADHSICTENFATALTIDDGRMGDSTYHISINELRANRAPAPPLLTRNGGAPGLPGQTVVESILLDNFQRAGGNSYKFDITVSFMNQVGQRVGQFRIARHRVQTDPTSPLGGKVITGCGARRNAGVVAACQVIERLALGTDPVIVRCPVNTFLVNGGGQCFKPDGTYWSVGTPDSEFGWLNINRPEQVPNPNGWEADCFNLSSNLVRAKAYATCCPN